MITINKPAVSPGFIQANMIDHLSALVEYRSHSGTEVWAGV